MKDERHVNLQRMEMTKRTANLMPDPSPAMIEIIGQLVENVYNVSGLLQKDLDARAAAVHSITQLIESNFPGLCVRTYGSYVTGIIERKDPLIEFNLKFLNFFFLRIGLAELERQSEPSQKGISDRFSWLDHHLHPESTPQLFIHLGNK